MRAEGIKIFFGYILICLLWGSTWLAIKVSVEVLNPLLAAGGRFLLASFFFYMLMRIKKIKLQTDPLSIKLYLIMGFFSFVIPFGLVYWAEQYIASGLTSVLFAVFPFLVILFSWIAIPSESIGIFKIIGAITGFTGIYIIFSENINVDITTDIWGMSAVVISAAIQAGIAVTMKKYGGNLNPLSMNFVPVLIAGSVMTLLSIFFEDISSIKLNSESVIAVVYLAFFGTVLTFTTYYWLLKRINVVILSLSAFITPIIAVILGWLILNERLSTQDMIGAACVLTGILIANFKGILNYYKLKTN